MGPNSQQTRLPINKSHTPSWLGPFSTAAINSEELQGADIDMFGGDFNWQDWARNNEGLELE